MKLYVIRHGQSETNLRGCYTGWAQVPLTEKGIGDAQGIRPLLEKIPFDKIYTSDLIRAKQTAENAIPGCSYEETALLREICLGSLEHKPITSVAAQKKEKNNAIGYAAYGGESREVFEQRVREFMALAEKLDCEYVAAFTHLGCLRSMLDQVLGVRVPRGAVCCDNCTVAIFEYKNARWQLHGWINAR